MQDDLHAVRDLRIIKYDAVQPLLTFMPAAHRQDIAVGTKETEVVFSAFRSIQHISGSLHGSHQLILLSRVIMHRLGVSLIPFTHDLPPRSQHHCRRQ